VAILVAGEHRALGHLGAGVEGGLGRHGCICEPTALHRGLAPLMIFVAWSVHKENAGDSAIRGPRVSFGPFFTGILGGVGNLAFFQALVVGGKASVVAPVTALFPMVTACWL